MSVIIPAYCPDFLDEAITSVEQQTFENWELIVVDDDSPSKEIEGITARHPRAQYLWQKNAGPSEARNHGIRVARGDLIAFLDDDDVWLPQKLEKQLACYWSTSRPELLGVIYTGQLQLMKGKFIGGKVDSAQGDVYKHLLFGNFIGTCSSVLIPRKVFDQVGMFSKELICAQDFELFLRIARQFEVRSVDEMLIGYRSRPGQITKNAALNNRDDREILRLNKPHISPGLYRRVERFHRLLAGQRYKESAYRALFDHGRGGTYARLLVYSVMASPRFPSLPSLAFLIFALLPGRFATAFARWRSSRSKVRGEEAFVTLQRVDDPGFTWAGLKRGGVLF